MKKLAVIRLRGRVNMRPDIRDTLNFLNLKYINNCIVVNNSPSISGMIKKVNNYVTWGEIDEQTFTLLKEKRGKEGRKNFKLHPAKKGLGRKGIKKSFKEKGALGYRGSDINKLIRRML